MSSCKKLKLLLSLIAYLWNAPFKGHLCNSCPATTTLGCGFQGRTGKAELRGKVFSAFIPVREVPEILDGGFEPEGDLEINLGSQSGIKAELISNTQI